MRGCEKTKKKKKSLYNIFTAVSFLFVIYFHVHMYSDQFVKIIQWNHNRIRSQNLLDTHTREPHAT